MDASEIERIKKETLKRLDELVAESDVTPVEEIMKYSQKHLQHVGKNYQRFMNQFEMYFSSITSHAHHVNYQDKKHWPLHRGLQFVAMVHALKPMYSGYILFYNGFYEDSIILQRSAYETFVKIIYMSCHPEKDYHALVKDEKLPRMNVTNFIKQDLKLDWTTYGIMSAFHHSNQIDIMEDVLHTNRGDNPQAVTLRYKVDKDRIGLVTNFYIFLLAAYMNLITKVFTVDYTGHPKAEAEQKKAQEYADILLTVLKTHSENKYWREVGNDLEDIFELLNVIDEDKDKDWSTEWKRIRSR